MRQIETLDPRDIELANAYGPYTHGTWVSHGVGVGNEEALAGRGAFMARLLRESLSAQFTPDEMRGMTLVDVGCYDGWLLHQLEDLPFGRLIGVEPREKNLEKGRMIRRLLGIETRCEFRQGSIENLEEALSGVRADVVVCAGLFHHLPSTADGVARLRAVCGRFLFIETQCIPATIEDDRLRDALELKDLPYFFGTPRFGATGHKLESGYYDGSATRMSVVSLPSVETMRMFLEVAGFEDVKVIADPVRYSEAVSGGGKRRFSATCITARPGRSAYDPRQWISEYEGGLLRTLLPAELAEQLYRRVCLGDDVRASSPLAHVVFESLAADVAFATAREKLRTLVSDRYALEIIGNLRYAPADKIALEHAKCLVFQGRLDEAEAALFRVTRRLNADWRAVYRAFCVLSWLYTARRDSSNAERYAELCLVANPQFPRELLQQPIHTLRPPTEWRGAQPVHDSR